MSSLIVKVCEVYRIEKHPNADKLSIVTVDNEAGWSCIVGLDQYLPGDKIVYVPPDCIVPEKLIAEGCVIKMLEEGNDPRIGRKILKSISPDYLTRKGGTEFK